KKTHSSSIDEDVADRIRRHFGIHVETPEAESAGALAQPAEGAPEAAAPFAPGPSGEPSLSELAPGGEEPSAAAPELFPPGWTLEERLSARPAAHPLRPPLLGGGPRPAFVQPTAGAAPAGVAPSAVTTPGLAARPAVAGRPLPSTPRPGQIISGPRQPLAAAPGLEARPIRAGALRPAAQPPPAPQAGAPNAVVAPRALAGQPAARPVVPPRPDLVERLRQSRATPGQPAPRAGAQFRPATIPIPGQPIYRGPIRPGQPLRARTTTGAPLSPAGSRGRGLHPTTPLRPEPSAVPLTDTRRGQRDRGRPAIDREREREGRLLRLPSQRREEIGRLAEGKQVIVAEGITVKELSEKLGLKANLVIKKLVDRKIFATINQTLDVKLAEDLARDFGAAVSSVSFEQEAADLHDLQAVGNEEDAGPLKRAPIVTIMGHVDHGKTSLLDAIRQSRVAEGEAGGITQHIGAYTVEKNGRKIVFIDTPGHEAFTRMRARGAKVTDIVVLVVASDDGVMPQTLEAIDHARAAKVPIIVAINKIDKADAQPERVKQQLSDRGLVPEDWGGEIVMVPVSARTKENLELLLEMILLVADMQELKANPARPAVATVLEAKLDRGRGPVATVLVRNGTLHVGDYFISGSVFGRVRAMFDDRGNAIRDAEPAAPAEVLGLESLPEVGETLQVVTDTAKAKQIVVYREAKAREQAMAKSARLTLDQLHKQLKEGETKELPIILKADVGGSAEVLAETLQKLSTDKVRIQVIHSGVGAITETDVLLASASNAIIIGFNVRPDRNALALAEQEKVDIRLHTIIYDLTDEIKRAMAGMLEPVFKEVYRGRSEVREIFRISKVGTVAGCLVIDGAVARSSEVRVLRDSVVVYTGKLASLKRFKDDASEVRSGLECGMAIENFNDVKPGDIIEAFSTERVAPEVLV
ncbi:MAG: translation initiation factor IF-2, partial [Bryobacteraceae bacterium]